MTEQQATTTETVADCRQTSLLERRCVGNPIPPVNAEQLQRALQTPQVSRDQLLAASTSRRCAVTRAEHTVEVDFSDETEVIAFSHAPE